MWRCPSAVKPGQGTSRQVTRACRPAQWPLQRDLAASATNLSNHEPSLLLPGSPHAPPHLVDAHQPVCQLKHVVAQADDHKLRVLGALLDVVPHDGHVLEVCGAGARAGRMRRGEEQLPWLSCFGDAAATCLHLRPPPAPPAMTWQACNLALAPPLAPGSTPSILAPQPGLASTTWPCPALCNVASRPSLCVGTTRLGSCSGWHGSPSAASISSIT